VGWKNLTVCKACLQNCKKWLLASLCPSVWPFAYWCGRTYLPLNGFAWNFCQ
jgi:hypothetical protein